MTSIWCGCGRCISKIDDQKDNQKLGECEECTRNGGDYTKSSMWNQQADDEAKKRMREASRLTKNITPLKKKHRH